jgi:hypothetical protein
MMRAFAQPLWPPPASDPNMVDLDALAAESREKEKVA